LFGTESLLLGGFFKVDRFRDSSFSDYDLGSPMERTAASHAGEATSERHTEAAVKQRILCSKYSKRNIVEEEQ
jgi:hypothetical protein